MIRLPRLPRGAEYALRHVRNSETQKSGTGGSLTGLNRAGDHWAVEVDPGVLGVACGRELLADIVQGTSQRIRVPLPMPLSAESGLAIGAPVVVGDEQAGSQLAITGMTPNMFIRKGWFFTLETADGASAHIVTAEVVADADGAVTVSFWPMLWLPPADGDRLEFEAPYLDGLIVDEGDQASSLFKAVRNDPFVVEEG